ncbi:MAG: Holliday junction resolvase RuvX [Candidatus Paceibacterota bacterium]
MARVEAKKGKIIGIDYGTKKVGVAISDEDQGFAFPSRVLFNDGNVVEDVKALAEREGVVGFVVGDSRNFAGDENLVMYDIRTFAEMLERKTELPVYFEEEFMTSAQARRVPQASDELRSRKEKNSAPVDASAAALILQSYLDKQNNNLSR